MILIEEIFKSIDTPYCVIKVYVPYDDTELNVSIEIKKSQQVDEVCFANYVIEAFARAIRKREFEQLHAVNMIMLESQLTSAQGQERKNILSLIDAEILRQEAALKTLRKG